MTADTSVLTDLSALKLRLQTELRPTRAEFPPWPEDDTLARLIADADQAGLEELAHCFVERERVIREARENPFDCGYEWECWLRADRRLPVLPWDTAGRNGRLDPRGVVRELVVLGGNRASKSEYAVKRTMQFLTQFPDTRIVYLCQKLETSRQIQQEYCWRYMPPKFRGLNDKKDPRRIFYIKYQKGTGFSGEKFILPNGSEGIFLVYTQAPSDYEGIQIGCPDQPGIPGWCADESMPLEWLKLMRTRSATRDAVGLWTFTPLSGMTQALKDAIGRGRILESGPEDALEGRQCVPALPAGYLPLVQEGSSPRTMVVYFHSHENPLGGYERLCDNLKGKPWYMVERGLCGYTRDTRGRLFTTFGSWNVVAAASVPVKGTVYMHVDPHSARNWFMLWVLVDDQGRIWAFDEWPPEQEYGEWAVTTERNPSEDSGAGWDGDVGPAQEPVGWGITQYKAEILRREAASGLPSPFRRTLDRRAGPAPVTMGSGPSTCLWTELNEEQRDARGEVIAHDLVFELAGGPAIEDDGIEMVKESLWVDMDRPIDPMNNYPRLFVSERCKQLIWALENFTGRDRQRGACKDPIDCLRDMFTSGLEYAKPGRYGSFGGGSY